MTLEPKPPAVPSRHVVRLHRGLEVRLEDGAIRRTENDVGPREPDVDATGGGIGRDVNLGGGAIASPGVDAERQDDTAFAAVVDGARSSSFVDPELLPVGDEATPYPWVPEGGTAAEDDHGRDEERTFTHPPR